MNIRELIERLQTKDELQEVEFVVIGAEAGEIVTFNVTPKTAKSIIKVMKLLKE